MNAGIIARRYANVLYDFASDRNQTEKVYADSQLVYEALVNTESAQSFLESPLHKPAEKRNFVQSVFKGVVGEATMQFMTFVADKERASMMKEIMRVYMLVYKEHNNIKSATITTAWACDADKQNDIKEILSKKFNAQVDAQFKTQPNIIGGVIIEVDGKQIDCSVSGRLRDIAKVLVKN